jgi:hypothetical protein
MQILLEAASVIWITGIVVLLTYSIISYIKVKRHVRTATLLRDCIWESDTVSAPFVFGFSKPRIYIPVGLGGSRRIARSGRAGDNGLHARMTAERQVTDPARSFSMTTPREAWRAARLLSARLWLGASVNRVKTV